MTTQTTTFEIQNWKQLLKLKCCWTFPFYTLFHLSSSSICKRKYIVENFWWRKCDIHLSNPRRKTNWIRSGRHTKNHFICMLVYSVYWFHICNMQYTFSQNVITMSQFILLKTVNVQMLGVSFRFTSKIISWNLKMFLS